MSNKSSEEILLQVSEVRYKKNDGVLYLMGERLGWMMKNRDQFTVVHKYADIKMQKISPEGKAKVQLQIVLHGEDSATTFHFNDPTGTQAQLAGREKIKQALQHLLPKFKKKVNKELEDRHRILSESPVLRQLYKDLVITQIVTAEQFWSEHASAAPSKTPKVTDSSKEGSSGLHGGQQSQQLVGISASFLSDIRPQADGANGLKYNLTPDIIDSIFTTYPAVRRRYRDYVPLHLTQEEFWTRFFQSHYFHRDRVVQPSGQSSKDIFYECAKDDDHFMEVQLRKGTVDQIANVSEFNDYSLDLDSYGGGVSQVVIPDGKADTSTTHNSSQNIHQNMIKRFNQHSIMVLRAAEKRSEKKLQKERSNIDKGVPSTTATLAGTKSSNISSSNGRIFEKLTYEDLQDDESSVVANNTIVMNSKRDEKAAKRLRLVLSNKDGYLNGPITASGGSNTVSQSFKSTSSLGNGAASHDDSKSLGEKVQESHIVLKNLIPSWSQLDCTRVLTADKAITAVVDLSPGGSLMTSNLNKQSPSKQGESLSNNSMVSSHDVNIGGNEKSTSSMMSTPSLKAIQPTSETCPEAVKLELRQLYSSVGELCSQFWSCFPPSTPQLQDKIHRMFHTLQQFQAVKVRPFEQELLREQHNASLNNYAVASNAVRFTGHINRMLEAAFTRYNVYKSKQ